MTLAILTCLALSLPQGTLDVEVTAKDKEPVAATWRGTRLTLDTEFGSATIEPAKLEQVLFGEPDVVFAAGIELRGKLGTKTFEFKIDGRSQKFSGKDLTSLVVLRDGEVAGAPGFGGAWMTSFGPAELQQRGSKVTGTYGFGSGGKIEGRVTKGVLEFTYKDDDSSGQGRFELLDGGEAFTGSYGEKGFWGGYRRVAVKAAPEPGKVTSGQTQAGLRYHVRWPKSHAAGATLPAIAILHGSNMDGRAYVDTIAAAWPELAESHLVVGFDGERLSSASKAGSLRFNYTYVNFGGPEVGPAWAHRQSPALVAEALQQLRADLGVGKWFLGGHSQGGFLTYVLVMFYPELLAGAFPMSCNLLVQCEPGNFDDAQRRKQHRVPVAVIHGQRDRVVDYDSGQYCNLRMLDGDFPFVHFYRPERVGHEFALLPVAEAIAWMSGASSDDPEQLLTFAEARAKEMWWRDVGAALARLDDMKVPTAAKARVEALAQALATAAAADGERLAQAMRKDDTGAWIDEFLEYRTEFATAPAAAAAMKSYAALRKQQAKRGEELFGEWRSAKQEERAPIVAKIAAEAFATRWYPAVRLWSK